MITAQIKEVEKVTAQAKPLSLGAGVPKEETDPTVPDWAKQEEKPTYTAAEVGAIPVPSTATVGQTIRVSAVDESGKPTKWEAVDFPEGGGGAKLLVDYTTTEETLNPSIGDIVFNKDTNGNPFAVKNVLVCLSGTVINATDNDSALRVYVNDVEKMMINTYCKPLNQPIAIFCLISVNGNNRVAALYKSYGSGTYTDGDFGESTTGIINNVTISGNNYNKTHLAANASIKIWGWD